MSERGMLLALQRLHDDPGFMGRICDDPQSTLGIYDIDDAEREQLLNACQNGDTEAIARMARGYGMNWQAEHVAGIGALADDEVSLEIRPTNLAKDTDGVPVPGAMANDGYHGVQG